MVIFKVIIALNILYIFIFISLKTRNKQLSYVIFFILITINIFFIKSFLNHNNIINLEKVITVILCSKNFPSYFERVSLNELSKFRKVNKIFLMKKLFFNACYLKSNELFFFKKKSQVIMKYLYFSEISYIYLLYNLLHKKFW